MRVKPMRGTAQAHADAAALAGLVARYGMAGVVEQLTITAAENAAENAAVSAPGSEQEYWAQCAAKLGSLIFSREV